MRNFSFAGPLSSLLCFILSVSLLVLIDKLDISECIWEGTFYKATILFFQTRKNLEMFRQLPTLLTLKHPADHWPNFKHSLCGYQVSFYAFSSTFIHSNNFVYLLQSNQTVPSHTFDIFKLFELGLRWNFLKSILASISWFNKSLLNISLRYTVSLKGNKLIFLLKYYHSMSSNRWRSKLWIIKWKCYDWKAISEYFKRHFMILFKSHCNNWVSCFYHII